jgi:hypothetical protein
MGLLQGELSARYGPEQRPRIQRGLAQTARFWQDQDGGAAEYEDFVRTYLVPDPAALEALQGRLESALETLEGRQQEIRREFRRRLEQDLGPLLPVDSLLAGYDPGAHMAEDLFQDKLAFAALLNFPLTTLEERRRDGAAWDRVQWAQVWLADRFALRAPGLAFQALASAQAAAEACVDGLRIPTARLVDGHGRRLFPGGPRLLVHWGLRDEIRRQYGMGRDGLARQRQLQQALERLVEGGVPAAFLADPGADWDPAGSGTPSPEPDPRCQALRSVFHAARQLDPWCPLVPTHLARGLVRDRQLPEARLRPLLEQVCGSPLLARAARLIRARLGRPLEPFDLWYGGFDPGAGAALDAQARARYPDAAAFRKDLPGLLAALGFPPDQAAALGAGIQVEPARGPSPAPEAGLPSDPCPLDLRLGPDGMDARTFAAALHGLGHAAARRLAREGDGHPLAAGLPGPAFDEALAFLFQARAPGLLGAGRTAAPAALDAFWSACAASGAALVELDLWHWMYGHPDAGPAELQAAAAACARSVWNRWFADAFGRREVVLLAASGDLFGGRLVLQDYPVGRMIAQRLLRAGGDLGGTFPGLARLGRLTPDLWLQRAAGVPLGPEALLEDAEAALAELERRTPVAAGAHGSTGAIGS